MVETPQINLPIAIPKFFKGLGHLNLRANLWRDWHAYPILQMCSQIT